MVPDYSASVVYLRLGRAGRTTRTLLLFSESGAAALGPCRVAPLPSLSGDPHSRLTLPVTHQRLRFPDPEPGGRSGEGWCQGPGHPSTGGSDAAALVHTRPHPLQADSPRAAS